MKKKTQAFILFVLISNINFSQNSSDKLFFNSFISGTSLTIRDAGNFLNVYEYSWNLNACTSIGKYFYTGIQALNIFLDYNDRNTKYFSIIGIFFQYNIAPNSKFRPFLEISMNRGNYYFPENSDFPLQNHKHTYVGLGGGLNIPLKKISDRLFIDLSYVFYIQKIENSLLYDYNQYIIGLDYRFGKNRE